MSVDVQNDLWYLFVWNFLLFLLWYIANFMIIYHFSWFNRDKQKLKFSLLCSLQNNFNWYRMSSTLSAQESFAEKSLDKSQVPSNFKITIVTFKCLKVLLHRLISKCEGRAHLDPNSFVFFQWNRNIVDIRCGASFLASKREKSHFQLVKGQFVFLALLGKELQPAVYIY